MKQITLLLLSLILAGCSAFPSSGGDVERNLDKWEAQDISDYRFNLHIGCFCPWSDLMPLTIEVRDGEPVSITSGGEQVTDPFLESFRQYDTVEELFGVILSAQESGADEIKVEYDLKYGFPTSIAIDYIELAMDDEMGFYVTEFEVLK
jgi:hypothetical protein